METITYMILYRGKLATLTTEMGFPLTLFRAKNLANKLMRDKGWAPADIQIVIRPTGGLNG